MGANLVGIAPAEIPEPADNGGPHAYQTWIEQGRHGTMNYMARNAQTRQSVTRWFPPAKSVVLLGFSYAAKDLPAGEAEASGRVAQYARSPDYHHELKARLRSFEARIRAVEPQTKTKLFVDTSPVLERLYGRYAGIGWVGKNTMLISPEIGSFFFLCGLAIDRELTHDEPVPDHCGTCNRCIEACPTDAFPAPNVLDASRCIAYLTIEHRGAIPPEFRDAIGDWLFGCDVCQDVCPWNRFSVQNPAFTPKIAARLPLNQAASLSSEEFNRTLGDTPIERTRHKGLLRNALLLMGNSKDPAHAPTLETFTTDPDPVISEQARWSLGRTRRRLGALLSVSLMLFVMAHGSAAIAAEIPQKVAPDATIPEEPRPTSIPQGMEQSHEADPWYIRVILHPVATGMSLYLPTIDTDPNSGVTYGIMPIWVLKGKTDERIRQIHAPSLTHNQIFRWTPTYRYYFYPKPDSSFSFRASASQVVNRELFGEFQDFSFLDKNMLLGLKLNYNVDGSNRFFGMGPNSLKNGESNYVRDTYDYYGVIGSALYPTSQWHINLSNHIEGDKISNGPISSLPDITSLYPNIAPDHFHQNSAIRVFVNYDSRDGPIATTEGAFTEFYAETAQESLGSEYVYHRYGSDVRYFYKYPSDDRFVTAAQIKFEQVLGDGIPFWLYPQMGGKYVFRAYGEGRYTDKGIMTSNIEERYTFYQHEMGGVTTEFEFAPFAGLGTVFPAPDQMAMRYERPVLGAAVRAVAPPQVVGSVDFGVGQEGLSIFMDINYSF